MSDTPRTDEAERVAELDYERHREAGDPAFPADYDMCRTLERELAEARRQVEAIAMEYSHAVRCRGCRLRDWCINTSGPNPCSGLITAWAAQKAKDGGK